MASYRGRSVFNIRGSWEGLKMQLRASKVVGRISIAATMGLEAARRAS